MARRRPQPEERTFTHAHRQRLERAIGQYLRQCYRLATAARVTECAAYVGVSAPYLSRIAPVILGVPLSDYLRQKQLEYAVQLLRTTPLPVREIAIHAAFGSTPTFYKWFVRTFQQSPAQFRECKK